jgi:hypothetical protein
MKKREKAMVIGQIASKLFSATKTVFFYVLSNVAFFGEVQYCNY